MLQTQEILLLEFLFFNNDLSKGFSADKVIFDDTETSLGANNTQEAIVAINKNSKASQKIFSKYGTAVTITSSGYTTESEGYLRVIGNTNYGRGAVSVNGIDQKVVASASYSSEDMLFIPKGSTLKISWSNGMTAIFYPIIYQD